MSISVSRTVVVRVHDALDEVGCQQLDRILNDLISQGVADLIVDLSHVEEIETGLKDVLDRVHKSVGGLGGTIEVRTPLEPDPKLLDLVEEIPTFVPRATNTGRGEQ